MKKKHHAIFESGYQAGYNDAYDDAYEQLLGILKEEFTEIDTKWSRVAANYCASMIDTINNNKEGKE